MNGSLIGTIGIYLLAGGMVGAIAWRNGHRTLTVLGAVGGLLALGLLFNPGAPAATPVQANNEVVDVGQDADFRAQSDQHPEMWGDLIAPIQRDQGLWVAPFRYGVMLANPSVQGYWRVVGKNVVDEMMAREGIPAEARPTLPAAAARYMDAEGHRIDVLYFYGLLRTSARQVGDAACRVYYQRQILEYPCQSITDAGDVGAIRRLPVGLLYWQEFHDQAGPSLEPSIWTPWRKLVVAGSAALLLVSGLAVRFLGLGFTEDF